MIFFLCCEDIGKGYQWSKDHPAGFSRRFGTLGYDYGWNAAYSPFDGGTIVITWVVNQLPETVSDTADSAEGFVQSYEMPGEWMGGTFTYSSESIGALVSSESIDYTISLTYYTWEFEDIREVVEV